MIVQISGARAEIILELQFSPIQLSPCEFHTIFDFLVDDLVAEIQNLHHVLFGRRVRPRDDLILGTDIVNLGYDGEKSYVEDIFNFLGQQQSVSRREEFGGIHWSKYGRHRFLAMDVCKQMSGDCI